MVPLTFSFTIPSALIILLIDYFFHETSRQNVSWSSSKFWLLPIGRLNSWCEIPSLSLDDLWYHGQHYCLPSNTNLIMLWSSLPSSLCYVLPWSITIFYVKDIVRIAPPLKNSWYGNTSRHLHHFLVPVVFLTIIPTSERCCLDSFLLATLLLWS